MPAASDLPLAPEGLAAAFSPRRIALVGASERPGKLGRVLWSNLTTFPGEVVPVTARGGSVDGVRAYAHLREIPGPVDLAVVAVPADAVPAVARDAADKKVGAMVVLTGGFAEAGPEGKDRQDRLLAEARRGNVRIIGPNCLGVQNCDLPLNASMATGSAAGGGGISLVTQSGAYGMAIHTLAQDEQARFAKLCSVGNQVDVTSAELLAYLADDARTTVACFLLESLPDGRAFYDVARRTTPRLPVVVARTGRSEAGARAARSHTAALAGDQAIASGAFEQAGIVQVRSGLEMMDVARALSSQPLPAGPRVGIVTNSGGTGVELADLLDAEGLQVPPLSEALEGTLSSLLPPLASPRNPVDITPVWSRFAELYPRVLAHLARSGEVDAVVAVLLHRSASDRAVAEALRDEVARLRGDRAPTPVYVCWVAPRSARPNADLLQEAGIPCFEWPERIARALGHVVRYARARGAIEPPPRPAAVSRAPGLAGQAGVVGPERAQAVLAAAGIPLVATRRCTGAAAAVAAAEELGYPVVAKVSHPQILHRSDVGGVRTGLGDAAAVAAAASELEHLAPGAAVVVQPQLSGVEVVVGGVRDPQFGPAVMVGLGGVLVEIIGHVAFGLAPLTDADALGLWRRLRARVALEGARGRPPVDMAALARLTRRVGDLLTAEDRLAEIDLNPVVATPDGAVAVDWRLIARDGN